MIPQINPAKTRVYQNRDYTLEDLRSKSLSQLKLMHNSLWDACVHEGISVGATKRRRKWKSDEEAIQATWTMMGIADGEVTMSDDKTTTEKPTPKCYSAETVKRPTRKMFMRIKKVGEPDKSQRPFAWPQFKNGMRLIDIKEDPNLHAGKISFWMRQEPPLIELEDISDDQFNKELDKWYESHGLVNPEAAKRQKAEERAKAKADREAERAKKAEEREKAKAAKAEAAAKKKAEAEATKEAKAKAKAEAKPAAKPAAKATKKAAAA